MLLSPQWRRFDEPAPFLMWVPSKTIHLSSSGPSRALKAMCCSHDFQKLRKKVSYPYHVMKIELGRVLVKTFDHHGTEELFSLRVKEKR